jgi:transcriptional regulator with XRE-family HTH domain
MQTDEIDPDVVRVFGNNLETCLQIIGSRPESLALRCNTSLYTISGFKHGLGTLSEDLLAIICKDIGISRREILREYPSPAEAIRKFEEIFSAKGKLTANNLIGATETRGEETMPPQITFPQGKLNDSAWRQNFGLNVQTCLRHMETTVTSLAIRTEMTESAIEQLLAGKLSLSNDDVEAIRLEIGLSTNDLIMDYIDNGRRNDELLTKLKAAGRIKSPTLSPEVEPETAPPTPEVPAFDAVADVEQEEPAPEPAIPAAILPAEELETGETGAMNDTNTVTWGDDDVTGVAGDRTFNLRNKDQRKLIGETIRKLKDEKCSDDSMNEFLGRVDTKRLSPWFYGLCSGNSAITGTDVETFAEFFGVPVWAMLTGELEASEPSGAQEGVTWDKDGRIATDVATGNTFDLVDQELGRAIVQRIGQLCPADVTFDELLDECCISQPATWFEAIVAGEAIFEENDIQALAEFLNVSELQLLSGEGLVFPEREEVAAVAASVEEAAGAEPVVLAEEPVIEPSEAATAAEDVSMEAGAVEGQAGGGGEAIQEHFKQRLLSADFHLADDVSPRSFLAATQAANVDWCSVYYTMTEDGVETMKQVATIAERFDAGDESLNMDIFKQVLSMALRQQ